MKAITAVFCVLLMGAVAWAELPSVPATPHAVDGLVYAQPFTLNNGFTYYWNKERPTVTQGTLLVIQVDPALVHPRQTAEPVLYVGDSTAQRINVGHKSGHVIALVPGEVDLTKAPIWFGTPDLPERIDGNMVQAERKLAEAAGIAPFPADVVRRALARGDATNAADMTELLRDEVAPLIERYSPQERELAEGFRVPVVRKGS
jgi:hypothetical protein